MLKQVWQLPRFQRWGIPLFIFLVAFGLRVVYPISRTILWSERGFHFVNAIKEEDWEHTYMRYHPGVTVMWLSGLAIHWYADQQGGLTGEQITGAAPTRPGVLAGVLQAGVFPLALVIAGGIALTYPLLSGLAGRKVAFAAAVFLAFDPFHVAYSKVIHPDGLLSVFMLLTALFALDYGKHNRWSSLVLSGVFAGLSFLSKSPSLFLFPYLGLALGMIILARGWQSRWTLSRAEWMRLIRWAVVAIVVWFIAAAVVFVVIWPVMWVKPLFTLQQIFNGVFRYGSNPHGSPVFFGGQIWQTDPGPAYYLAALAWKTTAITLPFIIISIWYAVRHWRNSQIWLLWAMMAYAFFFFAQMSIGQFKQIAYILPVAPALDIIAAFGLVWMAQALSQLPRFRPAAHLPSGVIAVALGLHALITLLSYPYFVANYNLLLGGARVARNILPFQDQGEGMEAAARYLSALPHGQDEIALVFDRSISVFQYEFVGETTTTITPLARYHVYDYNLMLRNLGGEEWLKLWEADQQKEPLMTVEIGGIPYVWVYGDLPEDPAPNGPTYAVNYQLGEHIHLEQVRLSDTTIQAGTPFTVVLHWVANGQINDDYVTFIHLLDSHGQLVAQQDNVPLFGVRPTETWNEGEQLEDAYILYTEANLPPGTYTLTAGMYQSQTIERLPIIDGEGNRQQDDRIIITEIQVGN